MFCKNSNVDKPKEKQSDFQVHEIYNIGEIFLLLSIKTRFLKETSFR
jgi:hypothetical protein